ncbi:probable voltage-gated shaker-like K+ channel, subunit beta/KCNAB [Phialocephala subalpina]|uniref:Probable voltage-gated shaker-like K+ channel, subunit beta/KCNAB n=1 Tax=Phialocephala subalpina TaxID=576137 RepID=A0A1L7X503_9HELO|nr:probable voltage-gated shaker-like K+ channel, subunit beta/KCNAB [Phialocephala subalpina]
MATLAGIPITGNGLGLMRLTLPNSNVSDEQAFKVLKAALAAGANVWNGADFYGLPTNNSLHLMNRYFTKYPEDASKVVFCLKTGVVDMRTFKIDASPAWLRSALDSALKILDGKKKIDIYGPCRVHPTPDITIEDTVAACLELQKEGKIGGIQLSEVKAETIRRTAKVAKIDMVEAEVSLWSTDIFTNGVAETCAELGIVISAHTPLGAGMLSGKFKTVEDMGDDHHKHFPRFQGENFKKNLELVEGLKKLATKKGVTTAQLALAWLKRDNGKEGRPWIVPIAGSSQEQRTKENYVEVELTDEELKEISMILGSFPVAGGRYPEAAAKYAEY